ncbi:MAG: dethiobiotin synthase [Rikenellaceae bacterium]
MKKGVYFISGIDTDAGKSYAVGILAKRLSEAGHSVITQKFIQTGGVSENGISLDINIHRQIMGCGLLPEDLDGTTCPVIFSYPASPHLAAKIDNTTINFNAIKESEQLLSSKYDYLLMEGAGGLCVPLEGDKTTIDFIADGNYDLIFVTSGKLGSINHTILSLEACKKRSINVSAILYNHHFTSGNEIISNDTLEYLKNYISNHYPNAEFIEIEDIGD